MNELNIEVRINGQSQKHAPSNESAQDISKLNLDVTTMMAYVSSLTCESCNWEFDQPILNEQAIQESLQPTKNYLDELFQG